MAGNTRCWANRQTHTSHSVRVAFELLFCVSFNRMAAALTARSLMAGAHAAVCQSGLRGVLVRFEGCGGCCLLVNVAQQLSWCPCISCWVASSFAYCRQ